MSKQVVLAGTTDYSVLVKIRDDAGAPATALTEASIDIAYARVETDNDVTTTDVTPAALTALTDAHTDWGFKEVSAADHPGLYRLDIADAVFASGAWSAVVTIVGTGLDPADLEFVIVGYNQFDGVRLGLTSLPNAAPDAAGGLIISDAGGLDADDLKADVTAALADTNELQTDWADGGRLDLILDARSSQSSLDTLDNLVNTEIADIRRAIGPATTTIATLASQTSWTLTAGSADNDAYNGWGAYVIDSATATQVALGVVLDYTGATKTITLVADPAVFTMAVGDNVVLLPGKMTDILSADVKKINAVTVIGAGTSGDKWRA